MRLLKRKNKLVWFCRSKITGRTYIAKPTTTMSQEDELKLINQNKAYTPQKYMKKIKNFTRIFKVTDTISGTRNCSCWLNHGFTEKKIGKSSLIRSLTNVRAKASWAKLSAIKTFPLLTGKRQERWEKKVTNHKFASAIVLGLWGMSTAASPPPLSWSDTDRFSAGLPCGSTTSLEIGFENSLTS